MTLIHPGMLAALSAFYPSTVTIQGATIARDTFGAETKSWADVTLLTALPCIIAVPSSIAIQAMRQAEKTEITVTHQIDLKGYYPTVTTAHRVTDGGVYFEIQAVEHDSQHISTRLMVRRLEPVPQELT